MEKINKNNLIKLAQRLRKRGGGDKTKASGWGNEGMKRNETERCWVFAVYTKTEEYKGTEIQLSQHKEPFKQSQNKSDIIWQCTNYINFLLPN